MATSSLSISLLRPAILHILRAAGFHGARGAAVDTIVDIAYRYMLVLAERTAEYSRLNDVQAPGVTEIRMALEDVGAFVPEISAGEEQLLYDDDLRGLQNFAAWIESDLHRQIRRIAGLEAAPGEVTLDGDAEREDFLTALKKKHSKTGEESKFQGTALGKQGLDKAAKIEGDDDLTSIRAWQQSQRKKLVDAQDQMDFAFDISAESSPLSEV